MKHIFVFKDDAVIYSGYAMVDKLEAEKRGNRLYLQIWIRDEFVGTISGDKYEIN